MSERIEYWVQYKWPQQNHFIGAKHTNSAEAAKRERKSMKLRSMFNGAEIRAVKITTTITEEVL